MSKDRFAAILPMITAALTDRIQKVYHLTEDMAIDSLYRTEFYKYLENEKTKVWQYSVDKMFDIYQTEIETGKVELPEY